MCLLAYTGYWSRTLVTKAVSTLSSQPGKVALSKVRAGKGKANLKVGEEREMLKGRRKGGEVHLARNPEASQT